MQPIDQQQFARHLRPSLNTYEDLLIVSELRLKQIGFLH